MRMTPSHIRLNLRFLVVKAGVGAFILLTKVSSTEQCPKHKMHSVSRGSSSCLLLSWGTVELGDDGPVRMFSAWRKTARSRLSGD